MYKSRIKDLEQQVSSFSMFHILNNPVVKEMNHHNHDEACYTKDLPKPPPRASLIGGHLLKNKDETKTDSKESFKLTKKIRVKLLALYDYIASPAQSDKGRLTFREGDVLNLIRKSKGGWWVAESNGKVGKIPSNYVEELDPSTAAKNRVVKGYEVQQNGDLPLKRGETIMILKKQENGWSLGEKDGIIGFFPNDCVKELQPPFC